MTRVYPFPKCDDCGNRFDHRDERARVRDWGKVCPLCHALNHGDIRWAIKNDCNGVFEEREDRAEAIAVCAEEYGPRVGCYVVPAVLVQISEDFHAYRAMHADWTEDEREARRLSSWRREIVMAIRARAA